MAELPNWGGFPREISPILLYKLGNNMVVNIFLFTRGKIPHFQPSPHARTQNLPEPTQPPTTTQHVTFFRRRLKIPFHTASTSAPINAATASAAPTAAARPSDANDRLIVAFLGQFLAQIYSGESPTRSHTPKPLPRPLLSASDRRRNRVRCASGRRPTIRQSSPG